MSYMVGQWPRKLLPSPVEHVPQLLVSRLYIEKSLVFGVQNFACARVFQGNTGQKYAFNASTS